MKILCVDNAGKRIERCGKWKEKKITEGGFEAGDGKCYTIWKIRDYMYASKDYGFIFFADSKLCALCKFVYFGPFWCDVQNGE